MKHPGDAPSRNGDGAGGPLAGGSEGAPAAGAGENELIERARGGDRGAFERLVAMHLDRVWKVVWRILRHREDCEDVVQDVFLAAWLAVPGYRGEARFSTWLHTIAVTRSLNHLDRSAEKVRRASSPLEDAGSRGGGADERTRGEDRLPPEVAAASSPSRSPSPLEALEADELMRRLAACLERLPAAWRAVLALRDSEESSYEEISRTLGLALGTVRSRLARARIALRQCVEGQA